MIPPGLSRVAALSTLLACSGGKPRQAPAEPGGPAPTAAPAPVSSTPAPVRRVQLRASVEQLSDMMAAVDAFWRPADPEHPLDSRGQLEAALLQSGFRASFLPSLDLGGVFAAELGIPAPALGETPARPSDWGLAGLVPAHDSARLLDSMPDTYRPQPLGGGLWELIDGEVHVKLRPRAGAVDVGREIADLDRASRLAADVGPGRRVRGRLWDIPPEWLEQVAGQIDPAASASVAELVRETRAVELAADLGTDRDALFMVAADAPFSRLGLGPLGKPATQPSPLARKLPGSAVVAVSMPWGDPALLHRQVDAGAAATPVPAPFDAMVAETIAAVHALLDQVRDEILIAIYFDRRGEATLLLAGTIADETATREAARTLLGAAEKAFSAHAALQGSAPEQRYKVALKRDVKVAGRKLDRLTVGVPGFLAGSVGQLSAWLGRKSPQLDAYALVSGNLGALAVGAGAEAIVGQLARGPGNSNLESDGGLALARTIDGGCHLCVAFDAVSSARAWLFFSRDVKGDKHAAKAAAELDRVRLRAEIALAVKVSAERGSIGMAVPRRLLSSDAKGVWRILKLLRDAQGPDAPPAIWDGLGSPPPAGA